MGLEQYMMKAYAFTSTLLLFLREHMRAGDEAGACNILSQVEERIAIFKHSQAVPASIMCRTIYRQIDMFIEKEKPPNISCREGCAHCCGQFVTATKSEARHLVKVAKAQGIVIDRERLKQQAGVSDTEWHTLPVQDQACVFLDSETKRCRVYRDRPLACRKYFVVGEPELCNINTNRTTPQPVWFQLDAELIGTAWMTVDGCESLPNLLLQEDVP